jgi:hypothetical protein
MTVMVCFCWLGYLRGTKRDRRPREVHLFFKVGVLTRVMSGRDTASLETGAGAKAANSNVDDLSEVIRALDKKAQGEYFLRGTVESFTTSARIWNLGRLWDTEIAEEFHVHLPLRRAVIFRCAAMFHRSQPDPFRSGTLG